MAKKSIKYAKKGAILVGLTSGIVNIFKQLNEIDTDSNKKFDYSKLLFSTLKGAVAGGVGGAVIGGIIDYKNDNQEKINLNKVINSIIKENILDKDDYLFQSLSEKSDNLSQLIEEYYSIEIKNSILRMGSTEQGTSLSNNYDIDLLIPFKPGSFSSTEEMYYDLKEFISDNYEDVDLVKIRSQKKSIGLIFNIDGEDLKIDLVPLKITKKDDSSGYLFLNNKSLFQSNSYKKTDLLKVTEDQLTNTQKKVLIALKIWRDENNVPISSHLLKLFILDAHNSNMDLNKKRIGLTNVLILIISHIDESILTKRIVSNENSNNVVTDIHEADKEKIRRKTTKLLADYQYNPNSILRYFP